MSDFDTDPKEVTTYVRDRMSGNLPPDFVGGVMSQVSRTPQRRRGWTVWNLVAGIATAAAAVVMVGIGLSLLNGDVGNEPTLTPTPTTSQSPSAAPSGPTPLPSLTPAIGCLDAPPGIEPLIALTDPVACLGNTLLTFDAQFAGGGVADCPVVVEPTWLSCSAFALRLVDETRKIGAPELFVAIDPVGGVILPEGRTNVRVTGRFDDPAAQTCREVERPPSPIVGGTPEPAAETIERCRRTFVVTEMVALEP